MAYSDVIKVDYDGLMRQVEASPENDDVFQEQDADIPRRLEYLNPGTAYRQEHFMVLEKNKIVAIGCLEKDQEEDNTMWMTHISVDENHRQQGLSKKIVKAIYQDMQERGMILWPSHFTPLGDKYLRPLIAKMHAQYPALKIRWQEYPACIVDGSHAYTLHDSSMNGCKVRFAQTQKAPRHSPGFAPG